MSIADQIGKAGEFELAEKFLDSLTPETKNFQLVTRIQELAWKIVQGKITAQQLREKAL